MNLGDDVIQGPRLGAGPAVMNATMTITRADGRVDEFPVAITPVAESDVESHTALTPAALPVSSCPACLSSDRQGSGGRQASGTGTEPSSNEAGPSCAGV